MSDPSLQRLSSSEVHDELSDNLRVRDETIFESASTDDRVREMVASYLRSQNQLNVEKNLRELLIDSGGFVERFEFFMPNLDPAAKEHLLISGCSAGSECLVAKRFGFSRVVGVEVSQPLVDICRIRLAREPSCSVSLYDGNALPYQNGEFSMVYSGHVIEHTQKPRLYFREHFRVLRPGGFFFLEFPNRYHHTELHTGLRSYEWLPLALRNLCLDVLSSPVFTTDEGRRLAYRSVRTTLHPISLWQLRLFCRLMHPPTARIVAIQIPAPGFMRVLIQK
jgi:SAM-dependent methyltransferase